MENTFELRDYNSIVYRLQLSGCLIVILPTVDQKLDEQHLKLLKENFSEISKYCNHCYVLVHQKEGDIKKALKKKSFPFPILSDSKARVIKQLNAFLYPIGIVQRSTFLYDQNSDLLFEKVFMSNLYEHFSFIE